MPYFERIVSQAIRDSIGKGQQVTIIYGPRQSGKTTLIKHIVGEASKDVYYATGDDLFAQQLFSRHEWAFLERELGNARTIVIDEAQKIDNIGLTLKLLVDRGGYTVIASGSASFDLSQKLNEPLTGRTNTFHLFPLLYQEIQEQYRGVSTDIQLEECLLYGMYPRIHTIRDKREKEQYLSEYLNTYLYKDILTLETVRKPQKVVDLLTLLALQLGSEVSVAELARTLSIGHGVVERYLDLLEKMFIIVPLRGFSRNLRKEVSKMPKYYFVDIGIRNALIKNFNPLALRDDVGALFENWFIVEVYKSHLMHRRGANRYFWRTYNQEEVDFVVERDGILSGYECKWSPKSKETPPKSWTSTYPNATYEVVHRDNVREILDRLEQ